MTIAQARRVARLEGRVTPQTAPWVRIIGMEGETPATAWKRLHGDAPLPVNIIFREIVTGVPRSEGWRA